MMEEEVPEKYSKAIFKAESKEELIDVLSHYEWIAADALDAAKNINDFFEFKNGLRKERKGIFAGEEWSEKYSSILMPKFMFQVSIVAEQFKVPWQLAYHRIIETFGSIQAYRDRTLK